MIKVYEENSLLYRNIYELLKLFYKDSEICFIHDKKSADLIIKTNSFIFLSREIESVDTKKDKEFWYNVIDKMIVHGNDRGYGDVFGFGLGASSFIDCKRIVASKDLIKYLNSGEERHNGKSVTNI